MCVCVVIRLFIFHNSQLALDYVTGLLLRESVLLFRAHSGVVAMTASLCLMTLRSQTSWNLVLPGLFAHTHTHTHVRERERESVEGGV